MLSNTIVNTRIKTQNVHARIPCSNDSVVSDHSAGIKTAWTTTWPATMHKPQTYQPEKEPPNHTPRATTTRHIQGSWHKDLHYGETYKFKSECDIQRWKYYGGAELMPPHRAYQKLFRLRLRPPTGPNKNFVSGATNIAQ